MISGRYTLTRSLRIRPWRIPLVFMVLTAMYYIPASGATLDTIRLYDSTHGYIYYRSSDIQVQAARYELPAPGYLREVSILLDGPARSEAILHVYGHEGGLSAPLLEKNLIAPIRVVKRLSGIEWITLPVQHSPYLNSNQIFIALDGISTGLMLLSDHVQQMPNCASDLDYQGYQFLKSKSGNWQYGSYRFALGIVMEYDKRLAAAYLADVASSMGIVNQRSSQCSLAATDVDKDGFCEFLIDGQLYRNVDGDRFENITERVGLHGRPRANLFIDANNDGNVDVVFLGIVDGGDTSNLIFLNEGGSRFVEKVLSLPAMSSISSVAIADADEDGYLDMFVGGEPQKDGNSSSSLLINNHQEGFIDRTASLYPVESKRTGCSGSQWVDYNNDGHLDLFVRTIHPGASELWENHGNLAFVNVADKTSIRSADSGAGVGCDWKDYDGNGKLDLLFPISIPVTTARVSAVDSKMIVPNIDRDRSDGGVNFGSSFDYEERRAGGTWGDVNNDGLLDLIITSPGECRYANLYLQTPGHAFENHSYEYGLQRAGIGPDAIWLDFNNDGKLDLATFIDHRFVLLKNSTPTDQQSFLEIEPIGEHSVGAQITLHCDGVKIRGDVTSGRGLLMQEPLRLHFGLAGRKKVDSITVRWSNGQTEAFRDVGINTIAAIHEAGTFESDISSGINITASPNPFSTSVSFELQLSRAEHINLGIYTLDGRLVRSLVNADIESGESQFTWNGVDATEVRVPQGTYLYRLKATRKTIQGKIVLVR